MRQKSVAHGPPPPSLERPGPIGKARSITSRTRMSDNAGPRPAITVTPWGTALAGQVPELEPGSGPVGPGRGHKKKRRARFGREIGIEHRQGQTRCSRAKGVDPARIRPQKPALAPIGHHVTRHEDDQPVGRIHLAPEIGELLPECRGLGVPDRDHVEARTAQRLTQLRQVDP